MFKNKSMRLFQMKRKLPQFLEQAGVFFDSRGKAKKPVMCNKDKIFNFFSVPDGYLSIQLRKTRKVFYFACGFMALQQA